jgi:hypothetical protein
MNEKMINLKKSKNDKFKKILKNQQITNIVML